MSVSEAPRLYPASPFAGAGLTTAAEQPASTGPVVAEHQLNTPFAEPLASFDESDLEAEAYATLRAEFEDEEFAEALEALTDEVAARHLTATGSWSQESEGLRLAGAEAEQWMETVAVRADQLLAELETQFADRPATAVGEAEIDAVAGYSEQFAAGPVDAQELFLGKLIGKVKKVVKGVGKVVGKMLPLGKLFGFLRKLIRPLLERVLKKAIGKLPPQLQPIATKLAAKFTGAPAKTDPAAAPEPAADATPDAAPDAASAGESPWSTEALADGFDSMLAEAVLTPHEAAATELFAEFEAIPAVAGEGPYDELDTARQNLARQLVEAEPDKPPIAEMEQFIPAVMAAMKLIKLGVKVIGRKRVVSFVAKLLATLISGMIGPVAAKQLSGPVADAGLKLLGLEAEGADGMLGAEALVATAEDTVREVLAMPAESLDNELLLEAAVQEAFLAAAVRHFPGQVLRPDLVEARGGGTGGIWVMFPRSAGSHYRYKKFSVVQPVQLTRPVARQVIFADGETLEDRLLEAGAGRWPVQAEAHFYELLPGGEIGHLAAFELDGRQESYHDGAQEFELLAATRPLPIQHPPDRGRPGPPPAHGGHGPGTRVVRLTVPGLRLRRRSPFRLRLDLTAARPALRIHLHVSERNAHQLIEHLAKQRHAQVVALIRESVGEPIRQAMTVRLRRALTKRGITLAEGAPARITNHLAEAILRAVAKQLPDAAAALSTAARDPAPGVTLSFGFTFADRAAMGRGETGDPTLTIRPGVHRD
jgi:hypothetical protein